MYDHVHRTAGELLALQPTDMTITRTVRNSIFGFKLWRPCKGSFVTLRASTHRQLITVSQENTRWRPLTAVVMQSPRSFSAV